MEIDAMWDKIKKGLKDGAALSMEMIEEYTKVGKLKIDELAAKRKIERNFNDIGERVYELVLEGKGAEAAEDRSVKNAMANIESLKKDLVEIEKKIKKILEEGKASRQKGTDDEEIAGV